MIFARGVSDPLTSLVKKIDEANGKHSKGMGSFVVFLSNDEAMEKELKGLAEKEGLKNTVLSVMSTPSGPPAYKIAENAEITVVLYNKKKVEANYTFEKGKFSDKDVDKVVADLGKILPKK